MGTVREDYSDNGDAWEFINDKARSNAYRWGEEGIGGFYSLEILCLAPALNGKDPILKERLFGLTNNQAETTEKMLKNFIFTKFQRLHIFYNKYLINILKTNFLMMIWCQNHRSREETELNY
jgi:hypothetical protein